jgi:ribonuclease HI
MTIEKATRLNPEDGGVSNNVAEYEGVLLAIEMAISSGVDDLHIYTDSQLVMNQINGRYDVKQDHLKPLRERVWGKGSQIRTISISWVPREENRRADALCRKVDRPAPSRQNPLRAVNRSS